MRTLFAVFCAALVPALAQTPAFEVASVRRTSSDRPGVMNGGPLPPGPFNMTEHDPTRITWTNVRLIRVLMMAYDLPGAQISGPGWVGAETYDIQAPVPAGTTVDDFKAMVRNLLAERFKLAAHRETKEVSGYALEVAPGGIKVKPSNKHAPESTPTRAPHRGAQPMMIIDDSGYPAPRPGDPTFLPGSGFSGTIKVGDLFRATVLNDPMTSIAAFLGAAAGAPVEDRTHVTGEYDFHLEYKPAGGDTANGAEVSAPAPDLFDAIQKQLGLKLSRATVPQETLVIDRLEKIPTGN